MLLYMELNELLKRKKAKLSEQYYSALFQLARRWLGTPYGVTDLGWRWFWRHHVHPWTKNDFLPIVYPEIIL